MASTGDTTKYTHSFEPQPKDDCIHGDNWFCMCGPFSAVVICVRIAVNCSVLWNSRIGPSRFCSDSAKQALVQIPNPYLYKAGGVINAQWWCIRLLWLITVIRLQLIFAVIWSDRCWQFNFSLESDGNVFTKFWCLRFWLFGRPFDGQDKPSSYPTEDYMSPLPFLINKSKFCDRYPCFKASPRVKALDMAVLLSHMQILVYLHVNIWKASQWTTFETAVARGNSTLNSTDRCMGHFKSSW